MASLFAPLDQFLENWRGRDVIQSMKATPSIPITAAVLYVSFVVFVPKYVMAKREPVKHLKPFIAAWNLFFSVFSLIGFYYSFPIVRGLLTAESVPNMAPKLNPATGEMEPQLNVPGGLYTSLCYWNSNVFESGVSAFWLLVFDLSKIPEMMDTVFLVLQKKPVAFLHWYHHLTVMLFCWHAHVTYISNGLFFAVMNMGVHSIMYFYYFMCACGQRKLVRPFAPLITLLQLLQMVAGMVIVSYTAYLYATRGCDTNMGSVCGGLVMYVSYFVLFAKLFNDSYITKAKKRKERLAAKQAAAAAEAELAKQAELAANSVNEEKEAQLTREKSTGSLCSSSEDDDGAGATPELRELAVSPPPSPKMDRKKQ